MANSTLSNRKSPRLQNWNYGWSALYFVTIVTKSRVNYFGDISDFVLTLSEIGLEVENQWLNTPVLRAEMKIKLDEFIVMPNHFHGIIGIGHNEYNSSAINSSIINANEFQADHLSTGINAIHGAHERKNIFGPQRKNLGSIIRGFKSSVTTFARRNHILFDWQERFHSNVIWNETSLDKIRNYIKSNPKKWKQDRFGN